MMTKMTTIDRPYVHFLDWEFRLRAMFYVIQKLWLFVILY